MTRVGWIIIVMLAFSTPRATQAAPKDVVKKIEELDSAAVALLKEGEPERAKAQLMDALVMGKKNNLDTHQVMARTYLDLGVVQIEGLKDHEKAQRYFKLALRIKPDIEVPPALVSETVKRELDEARSTPATAKADETAKKTDEAAARKADEARKAAEAARTVDDARAQAEKEKLLAKVQDAEKKQREDREKLEKEKVDADKQLASVKESEKKQRETVEKLQKEKLDAEKQLASARESEKKEREARERLEKQLAELKDGQQKEKQAAEARDKERKSQEEKEKLARDKLAEGPEMPSHVPQPLYCPTADEGQQGMDLYVHCATQPDIKAKLAALYYRPSGALHFNSLAMQRSKKGWWTAVVPASFTNTKVLQYYVEVRNDRDGVLANYGRSASPNIMTLKAPGAPLASTPPDSLVPASAVTPAKGRKTRGKSR
jgi:hypothetical protein